jgi:multimeric flavodoxin WrbA
MQFKTLAEARMDADIRKGMPDPAIDRQEFRARFLKRFYDPAFTPIAEDLERATEIAWQNYQASRKSPRTRAAEEGFADPNYQLSEEWLTARQAVKEAEVRQKDRSLPSRVLIINASPRSEHTCPGEMSKTYRLVEIVRETLDAVADFTCEVLDLSRLASEYGRQIFPCKACFSTSPALCHWPCSCYPNHSLGQSPDWMNEIYPMWVAAHGIVIVSPVHWYQAPTALKLMMDRMVCADGGNPDPTTTHGKNVAQAKALESNWPYPRHLKDRVFSIIVHGDSAGAENLRRMLTDWLTDMELRPAGDAALLDRYIGYYKPYATSHEELDGDSALFLETKNAALTLAEAVRRYRDGEIAAGSGLPDPRPK